MTVTGAIFCGGKSSRMGRDKASLELSGRPMVQWAAAAMSAAGLDPFPIGKARIAGENKIHLVAGGGHGQALCLKGQGNERSGAWIGSGSLKEGGRANNTDSMGFMSS